MLGIDGNVLSSRQLVHINSVPLAAKADLNPLMKHGCFHHPFTGACFI